MKYAIQYNPKFRHLSEVDEIIFNYLDDLEEYAAGSDNPHQILIYHLPDDYDYDVIKRIKELKNKINSLTVLCNMNTVDDRHLKIFYENKISYFFNNLAKTKEMVDIMGQMGASSVYIVEELAFDLKTLQYMRNELYHFTYRVYPDVAQHTKDFGEFVPSLKRFFIRPEDTEIYEDYVDIFEFWKTDDRLSVIYEVYKQQQWLGNLRDIISGLGKSIDNKTLAPHFGQMRVCCNKVCLEGKCYLCEEMEKLAEKFAEANLEIVKKRKKTERTEEETEEKILELVERGKEIINESSDDEETV